MSVDFISSMAELSGLLPSVLIETYAVAVNQPAKRHTIPRVMTFFMEIGSLVRTCYLFSMKLASFAENIYKCNAQFHI